MKQSFKRIAPHLYKRQYQAANGEWTTLYYGILVDWKGKRRRFPLGSDRKTAREELMVYEARNVRKEDFDKDKQSTRPDGITLSEWAAIYFKEKTDPEKRTVEHERGLFKKLEPFFGSMALSKINRGMVRQYRTMRLQQPIMRHGKPVAKGKRVAFPTVNRELAFLRYLLNLAVDEELIESVPKFKGIMQSEKSRKRKRVASDEEYRGLLSVMTRPNQRVVTGLYETAMRLNELVKLTWDKVDDKAGMIRLKAEDVKEKAPRSVPITPEMQVVLNELKAEQKRVSNISNRVFTRGGRPIKSIRTAFELAKERKGIVDLHLHDFRHTAITQWSNRGIPPGIIMAASGHSSIEMHKGYVNVQERDLKEAFDNMFTRCLQENSLDSKKAVSY